MTTDATKRQTGFFHAASGRTWFRRGLRAAGLLAFVAALFFCARFWFFAPPALQPGDLLLLEPESIVRVEAAAKVGDILAQSTLGLAYLDGKGELPTNVTKAVYWLRKVADRDPSEFARIPSQMQSLLEQRQYEYDLRKRRTMDVKYLDLVARKLAFEAAFLGLIEVYVGDHGTAYANTALALKYMRRGAAYGFPSLQRRLGIVTLFGLHGVPKNEIEARLLLSEAAAGGDEVAQQLLLDLRSYEDGMSREGKGTGLSQRSFW